MKNIDIVYLAIISIKFMILWTMLHSDALAELNLRMFKKIKSENSSKQVVTQKAWERLINNAKKWSEANIDSDDDIYEFKKVYQKYWSKIILAM